MKDVKSKCQMTHDGGCEWVCVHVCECACVWVTVCMCVSECVYMYAGYLKLFQLRRPHHQVTGYDCILIDESQDLTPGQSVLLHSLLLCTVRYTFCSRNRHSDTPNLSQDLCRWSPPADLQFQRSCQCYRHDCANTLLLPHQGMALLVYWEKSHFLVIFILLLWAGSLSHS